MKSHQLTKTIFLATLVATTSIQHTHAMSVGQKLKTAGKAVGYGAITAVGIGTLLAWGLFCGEVSSAVGFWGFLKAPITVFPIIWDQVAGEILILGTPLAAATCVGVGIDGERRLIRDTCCKARRASLSRIIQHEYGYQRIPGSSTSGEENV